MAILLSIIGTLCIVWGLVRGFFSVLGTDTTQLNVSFFFVVLGIICIIIAVIGY